MRKNRWRWQKLVFNQRFRRKSSSSPTTQSSRRATIENVEGIVAGLAAFAGDEGGLRTFVVRDRADYVALCLPWMEAHPERYGVFARALANGAPAPTSLTPVPLPTTALKLWRVGR